MAAPRRRIIRTPAVRPTSIQQRSKRLEKLRLRLDQERAALTRWMTRLRRAFHAVERIQLAITRMERSIHAADGE
jgi:hypothetical protein